MVLCYFLMWANAVGSLRSRVCAIQWGMARRFSKLRYPRAHRPAAELAMQALGRGESIWWAADYSAASYYGLKPEVVLMQGRLQWMRKRPETQYPK